MVRPRLVEQFLDLSNLAVRPLRVAGSAVLEDTVKDGQQAEGDNGFFIDNVQLVADGPDGNTCTC